MKGLDAVGMSCYIVLLAPYLGDPADPSLVTKWRQNPKDQRSEWHDKAIELLAEILLNHEDDLFVRFPKRMSSMESEEIDRRNKQLVEAFRAFHFGDGDSRNKAIEKAAEHCGYSRRRAYDIVDLHEPRRRKRRPEEEAC